MQYNQGDKIDKYEVVFPHKESSYAETYRVKDENGKTLFLKLISYALLNAAQYDKDGTIIEVEALKNVNHQNILTTVDYGTIVKNGQQFAFIVNEYISSETASDRMLREGSFSVYNAKLLVKSVLRSLKCFHNLERPLIHNAISPKNVLIDLCSGLEQAKLIGLGHSRFLDLPPTKEDIKNLNPFYLAPERFNGVCAIQSDLFSVGAMMYQMIFGVVPWFFDISAYKPEDRANAILAKRCSQLRIPDINIFELDEQLINTMAKAMASDIKDRFQSADEFIQALNGEITIETTKATLPTEVNGIRTIKKGNGFADVAGMDDLKAQLKSDVIDLLENAGRAKELGLSIPNGLLFYRPPGCGKTFFAERFAEEIGCNYMYVLCSDVASPYIHGGQEKIANIFTEARKNAPTIVFLDEVEAMIMDRNKHSNVSEQGEVNEFLGQLNNCGHDGVMVIAATNKPGLIDPAALRAGRLELKYYIPQPDFETRKQLFKVGLRNRNVDLGIDYEKLSQLTEDRVSADIQLIVDTAARIVFRKKREKITMSELEEAISTIEPTVSKEEIHDAEKVRDEFLGKKTNTRPRIGF